MAHERLGERSRDARRRLGRLVGLALVGVLLIAGCDESQPVDPGQLPGGSDNSGSTGGGGSDTTSFGDASLVGTWVNVTETTTDLQELRTTTTWSFRDDGLCARSIVTETPEQPSNTLLRIGRCTADGTELRALFTNEVSPILLVYDVTSTTRMVLGGAIYDLVP